MVPGFDEAESSLNEPDAVWDLRHFRPRLLRSQTPGAPARVIFEGEWSVDSTPQGLLLSTDEGEVFELLWSPAEEQWAWVPALGDLSAALPPPLSGGGEVTNSQDDAPSSPSPPLLGASPPAPAPRATVDQHGGPVRGPSPLPPGRFESTVQPAPSPGPPGTDDSALLRAIAEVPFESRNDPAKAVFRTRSEGPRGRQSRSAAESHDESVPAGMQASCIDLLMHMDRLVLSPAPSPRHERRLAWCEANNRHTRICNWWMAESQLQTYLLATDLTDGSPLMSFATKLGSLDIPLANAVTPETRNCARKKQEWVLMRRFAEILPTGGLYVGSNKGFNHGSSFIALGCAHCHACVHMALPYLGSPPPKKTEAIQRHLANFLMRDPAHRNPLVACSAERAYPGVKHGGR